ncbi:MAG: hypothetical protein QM778_25875 [Myxococcales bacterium]
MSNSDVLDVLRQLISPDHQERELAAEELTDVVRSLESFQVALLASALVVARLCESNVTTQEAQLNALSELKEWHDVSAALLMPLKQLSANELPGSQAQHFADLLGLERG